MAEFSVFRRNSSSVFRRNNVTFDLTGNPNSLHTFQHFKTLSSFNKNNLLSKLIHLCLF